MKKAILCLVVAGLLQGCQEGDNPFDLVEKLPEIDLPNPGETPDETTPPPAETVPDEGSGPGTPPEALPETGSDCDDAEQLHLQMLALINQYRVNGFYCGNNWVQPGTELTWSEPLQQAAAFHAEEMANYDFFDHEGIDGGSVAQRVTDSGYEWSRVAENIGAGYTLVQDTINGWLGSEQHCLNMLSAQLTEIGAACASNSGAEFEQYWTLVLAAPLAGAPLPESPQPDQPEVEPLPPEEEEPETDPNPWQPEPAPEPDPNPWQPEPSPEPDPNPWQPEPMPEPDPNPWQPEPAPEPDPNPWQPEPSPEPDPNPWQPEPVPEPDPNPWQPEPTPEPEPDPWQPEPSPEPDPWQPEPTPEPEPEPEPLPDLGNCGSASSILSLVNQARAQGRSCGGTWYDPAPRLSSNLSLTRAAEDHSSYMANYNCFGHNCGGTSVGNRATARGYSWRMVGENIAAGQTSASQAVNGWLNSPGHCRNIMNPDFKHLGAACVSNPDTRYTYYWTQVFGTPR